VHNLLITGGEHSDRIEYATNRAQLLLCRNRHQEAACETCDNCRRIRSHNHPNVIFIEPHDSSTSKDKEFDTQTIKIDQIRQIIVENQRANFEQGLGIFIITHMHKTTHAAANALLKVIEENNAAKIFMALSPSRMAVLSTIASRLITHTIKPTHNNLAVNDEYRNKIHSITKTPPKERFSFCSQFSADKDELYFQFFELVNACHTMLRTHEISPFMALKLSEALTHGYESLKRNLNPRLVTEMVVLQKWPFQP
jgi:hypothetical protein